MNSGKPTQAALIHSMGELNGFGAFPSLLLQSLFFFFFKWAQARNGDILRDVTRNEMEDGLFFLLHSQRRIEMLEGGWSFL